ncbi:MAG: hypothetical protein QM756_12965 [Polyangiaceae bacterium]
MSLKSTRTTLPLTRLGTATTSASILRVVGRLQPAMRYPIAGAAERESAEQAEQLRGAPGEARSAAGLGAGEATGFAVRDGRDGVVAWRRLGGGNQLG